MSLAEAVWNTVSIALSVVFGTVLAWVFSFVLARKAVSKMVKQVCGDPEAVEALRLLVGKLGLDKLGLDKLGADGGSWILRRDESGRVVQVYREKQ
jgi:hypothetical protein